MNASYRSAPLRNSALLAIALLVAACGPSAASQPGPSAVAPTPPAPSPSPAVAASPTLSTGFAFDAESVVGYYETRAYACSEPQPSALAEGYVFTSCELVDAEGRRHVVGVVTDPNDDLADGFASLTGRTGESILDPAVALESLAGFLGAMLGPERGEALLPWLAGHLGEAFAETTSGDLKVATYIKAADHSTLYVEIASQAYLEAPRPSPSR